MLFMKPLLDSVYPDEPGMFGDGGDDTADAMRNSSEIDYQWACGACDAAISDSDSVCGSCGESVEWDQPPIV